MEILVVVGAGVLLGALVFVIKTPMDLTDSPEVRAWNERAYRLRELEDHAARVEVIRAEQVAAYAVGQQRLRALGAGQRPAIEPGQARVTRGVTPR